MIDFSSLDLYKLFVDKQAKNGSCLVFRNSGNDKAIVTLTALFNVARQVVRLYSGAMDPEITSNDEYKKAVENFLGRGGMIKLMLEKQPKTVSPVLEVIKEYEGKNSEQVKIKCPVGKVLKYQDGFIHLATFDETGYRLEIIPELHIAEVCFNNPEKVKRFNKVFDQVFTSVK